jgi:hypothetical protein
MIERKGADVIVIEILRSLWTWLRAEGVHAADLRETDVVLLAGGEHGRVMKRRFLPAWPGDFPVEFNRMSGRDAVEVTLFVPDATHGRLKYRRVTWRLDHKVLIVKRREQPE